MDLHRTAFDRLKLPKDFRRDVLVALVAAASNPVGWVALLATGVAIGAGLDAAVYDIGLAKGWWWD